MTDDEPLEFSPMTCLATLVISLAAWGVVVGVVTWLIVR